MRARLKPGLAVVAAGALLVVGGAGGATASRLVTGDDIAKRTITTENLAPSSVTRSKLAPALRAGLKGRIGPRGPQGARGPQGEAGPAGTVVYQGENWGIVDRNVIGNGSSYLRSGPAKAPYGVGSLGLRTGSGDDKAAFGNEVDFAGTALTSITHVSYWAYTTGENLGRYAENNVGVALEIDPTGADASGPNYTSLVYVPVQAPANKWTEQDASTAARWFMTGAAGADSCNQGPAGYCTLEQVQTKYPDATVLTVQLTKGRDYAFSGAADGLRINDTVYDFEPLGVRTSRVHGAH